MTENRTRAMSEEAVEESYETIEEKTLREYESKKAYNEFELKTSKSEIKDREADIQARETNIEFCDWIIEKLKEHIAEGKKKDAEKV